MTLLMPFAAIAFNTDSPLLCLSFVDLTCILCVSIVLKWTSRCLGLFVHALISLLDEIAGIACPTALFIRVHHLTCALLRLIPNPFSLHHCDTSSSYFWAGMTVVWVSLAVW